MIILNKPYVSDFLIETIKKNGFSVLENEVSLKYFSKSDLVDGKTAVEKYEKEGELFYTNSENSIDWVEGNLPNSDLNKMIKLSKDKALFRKTLQKIYPDYFFKASSLEEIKKENPDSLPYPIILKPTVGFLSFGVYPIYDKNDWEQAILKIDSEIEKLKGIFPSSVVDMNNFIIEKMIEGEEYALDAYFDENSEATILNIFKHPFFDGKDVSDRAYYTSKKILEKYLEPFKNVLDKIAKAGGYKNFPFHLELRVEEKTGNIIPIEINPLRFCGWCITDIAYFAWGVNVYEAFLNKQKPNWEKILKEKDDDYYYFTIGDIPSNIERNKIKEIDFDGYLRNVSNLLDLRKIDYKINPIFAIAFGKCKDIEEIKNILKLDMSKYCVL